MKSRKVGRGSISVTATSSAEKMVAYSTPITPAPITVRLRGSFLMSRISSLSSTVTPSKGTCDGRNGRVPQAISTCAAVTLRISPFSVAISIVCVSPNRA